MLDTYYGSYRTRTFAQIFPSLEEFNKMYDEVQIPKKLTADSIATLFYLLYGRYGNSHIAFTDENQFIYGVFSTIFMYGPSWEKRLEIQDNLRNLSEDDILKGSEATYNHAFNPTKQLPGGTSSRDGLEYINDQNKTLYTRSKMEGYANLIDLLETDVTAEFIEKFKKLFIYIVAPDAPLLYATERENEI